MHLDRGVKQQGEHSISLTFIALSPFALGYFLSYLLRAVNAVIEQDLVDDIGLGASELGLVTAIYLATFALFQLPLGVLLDRFGPRRVQTALMSIGGAGAILFALANDIVLLIVGRALIGLGFAGGLMAGFKAIVIWVRAPRRALGNAIIMSAGAVGLLFATAPVEFATQLIGWRQVFWVLATMTFAAALIIFLAVPERPGHADIQPLAQQIKELGHIFQDRAFLAIVPLLATCAGFHLAVQTLWAGPWFRDVAGLGREDVAAYLALIAIAFLIGILATGAIADRLARSGIGVLTVMLGFLAPYMMAQVGIILGTSNALMPLFWFLFGMLGQATILAYPWLASHFGAVKSGRAQTAANLIIFATAFVMQFAIGAIIDLFPRSPGGGYSVASYQLSFAIALGTQLLALAWYALNFKHLTGNTI